MLRQNLQQRAFLTLEEALDVADACIAGDLLGGRAQVSKLGGLRLAHGSVLLGLRRLAFCSTRVAQRQLDGS
ncbi:hypothetical protein D3C85_1839730 [compost metagenome]